MALPKDIDFLSLTPFAQLAIDPASSAATMSSSAETCRRAFPDQAIPLVSYGLSFIETVNVHNENEFKACRIYIIASGSLSRNTSHLEDLRASLGNKVAGIRIGMKSHTYISEVLQIVNDARRVNADLILSLGGGTLVDAAKIVSFALANSVTDEASLVALPHIANPNVTAQPSTIPIISVITSLSGGEYSSIAGVTRDSDHLKFQFSFPLRGPSLIILDPIIALTTPLKIWLGSGMRALDHCIEGFNNPGVSDNGEVQQSCVEGLKALVPGLLATAKDPNDADARLKCLLGVNQSMVPLHYDADFGASHGIGHMLGPLGVAHGETSCVLNPAVCAFNAKYGDDKVRSRQAALAKMLWNIEEARAVFEAKGYEAQTPLSALVDAVIRACQILPRSLREVEVGREVFEALAKNSIEDVWCTKNAVPVVRTEQVMEILAACA